MIFLMCRRAWSWSRLLCKRNCLKLKQGDFAACTAPAGGKIPPRKGKERRAESSRPTEKRKQHPRPQAAKYPREAEKQGRAVRTPPLQSIQTKKAEKKRGRRAATWGRPYTSRGEAGNGPGALALITEARVLNRTRCDPPPAQAPCGAGRDRTHAHRSPRAGNFPITQRGDPRNWGSGGKANMGTQCPS